MGQSDMMDVVHEYNRNPVLSNPTTYMLFNQYLQESWPENASRRGSAVIRATLYTRIVACLKARKCRKTFQKWVKANKFFLLEYPYQGAPNSVAYLGVPCGKPSSKTDVQPFKLVAKVVRVHNRPIPQSRHASPRNPTNLLKGMPIYLFA